MLSRLFAFFSNRWIRNRAAAEQRDFQMLNALAPVKDADPAGVATMQTEHGDPAGSAAARSVICREAVLNREQRVAGYEFMLRGKIHEQMRMPNRRPHYRFYNEVMINHLLQDSVSKLLGHRHAFITVLGSFLANPLFDRLLGQGMVLTALLLDNASDSDTPRLLPERISELKQRGFKFALEECFEGAQFEALAPHADYFILRTSQHKPAEISRSPNRSVSVIEAPPSSPAIWKVSTTSNSVASWDSLYSGAVCNSPRRLDRQPGWPADPARL
ncbi:MAG: hypothetical protein IPL99_11290 [Candidatus Competibacteraceae bacterium]|nr:hypothetical protein [Candidatus Competibacteraceae bacterium]